MQCKRPRLQAKTNPTARRNSKAIPADSGRDISTIAGVNLMEKLLEEFGFQSSKPKTFATMATVVQRFNEAVSAQAEIVAPDSEDKLHCIGRIHLDRYLRGRRDYQDRVRAYTASHQELRRCLKGNSPVFPQSTLNTISCLDLNIFIMSISEQVDCRRTQSLNFERLSL